MAINGQGINGKPKKSAPRNLNLAQPEPKGLVAVLGWTTPSLHSAPALATHPGLAHIFAVQDSETVFDPRRERADGFAEGIARRGACLHYYLYWIDPLPGLIQGDCRLPSAGPSFVPS